MDSGAVGRRAFARRFLNTINRQRVCTTASFLSSDSDSETSALYDLVFGVPSQTYNTSQEFLGSFNTEQVMILGFVRFQGKPMCFLLTPTNLEMQFLEVQFKDGQGEHMFRGTIFEVDRCRSESRLLVSDVYHLNGTPVSSYSLVVRMAIVKRWFERVFEPYTGSPYESDFLTLVPDAVRLDSETTHTRFLLTSVHTVEVTRLFRPQILIPRGTLVDVLPDEVTGITFRRVRSNMKPKQGPSVCASPRSSPDRVVWYRPGPTAIKMVVWVRRVVAPNSTRALWELHCSDRRLCVVEWNHLSPILDPGSLYICRWYPTSEDGVEGNWCPSTQVNLLGKADDSSKLKSVLMRRTPSGARAVLGRGELSWSELLRRAMPHA